MQIQLEDVAPGGCGGVNTVVRNGELLELRPSIQVVQLRSVCIIMAAVLVLTPGGMSQKVTIVHGIYQQ